MANPMYHDDPDWYERPGETVHLHVDANPAKHVVPALPWIGVESMADRSPVHRRRVRVPPGSRRCAICQRVTATMHWGLAESLCDYCARAQQRDETAKARANQPQPSTPRISVRENWEVWASEQQQPGEDLDSGHVRSYETRIA